MNDNKRKLYDALSQEYDMGTFEQFSTDIEDEAKRRKLYESIKGTYDLPDFNGFSSQLGIVAAQPQPTEQKQEVKSVGGTVVKPVVPTFTEQQIDSMERTPMASDTVLQQGEQFRQAAMISPNRVAPDVDEEKAKQRDAELQEAYAERKRLKEEEESYRMRQVGRMARAGLGMGSMALDDADRDDAKRHNALLMAQRQNEERIAALEESRDKNTSGFWRNLWRTITNPSTWSFGLIPLSDAVTANRVAGKMENDSELTDEEETLLQQMVMNEEAKQKYGDDKGFMARAGTITGEALPFVAEFLLTGGYSGVAESVGGATAKGLAKMTATDLSKKGLRSWLVKSTGTVAGDVAGATLMANTTGAAKTASDAMERHRGSIIQDDNGDYHFVHYEQDEDGNPVFVDGGKTWAQSIYEAEVANTLEYYTEMLGTHMEKPLGAAGSWIAEKAGLGKAGAYMVKKLGLGEVSKDLSQVTANGYGRAMKHVLERGGIQDYPSEVLEEEANIILNSMFVGDNSMSDLVDGRTQADIWGGMLFSVGFMNSPAVAGGTVDAASYLRTKHSMDNAERLASYRMTEDRWKPLRERIDGTSNEDFADLANEILADEDMHIEEKKAVLNYMGQLAKFRGFNVGSSAKAKDEVENPSGEQQGTVSRDLNTSYIGGYEANDEQLNDIKNGYEFQRQRLSAIVDDDYLQSFDQDPVNTLVGILSDGNSWSDEEKQTAIDYVNAKAAYDGMIHRVQDDLDGRIAMSDAMIDSRKHHDDGMIHPATMKTDDRKVYVIGGKLVMNEDGTMIDHDQSDESIIIRDAATGAIEFADPHDVLSTDEALDAAQEKEAAQEAIRQQYAQEAANKIDGVLPFNNGDTYQVVDEQGQQHTVTVIPTGTVNSQGQVLQAGDGEVVVSIDGAEPVPMSREAIQQMFDNANLARLQQYEQEQAAHREEQAAAEREANRPVYNINDEVTLQTEEGTVRGSITAEANEDGQYEVYTEEPINGKKINLFTRDELDNMLIEHNGNVAPQVQPTENESAVLPQGTTENGAGLDNAGGEAGAANGTGANNPPATALSRIPILRDSNNEPILNRKGKPTYQWHEAPVGDTADALTEQAGGVMLTARDVATDMVGKAKEQLEKVRKQKPKGEDPIELIESRNAIRQSEQQAQDIVKYWQDVNQEIQKRMREESARKQAEAEAAKSEQQKAREAEEKRKQEERLNEIERQRLAEAIEKDHERRNREYEPMTKARKEMANDPDALGILDDIEPRDLEEWVSSLLLPHSILWQDASENEVGLRSELGLKRGDMQRFMNLLGTKENGAKPFGEVVLDIYEGLPERMKEQYTDQDVRNTLLELFNEGSSGRMMNLTKEHRIEEAREVLRENLRREQEAEMEAWCEHYHLTAEERETFEDWLQQPPTEIEQEIIDQIIADNEQNQSSERMDQQPVIGGNAAGIEGSQGQVQQTTQAAGNGIDEETANQGAEAAGSEQAPVGDNVSAREQRIAREYVRELLRQTGEDEALADVMSDYEVEQLNAIMEDWDAHNADYGFVIEQQKDALKSKDKKVRDEAQAKVSEAMTIANEAFEPIAQYIEELKAKYGNVEEVGVIPRPKIDDPRFKKLRMQLADGYSNFLDTSDATALQNSAQAIRDYVDEGLDMPAATEGEENLADWVFDYEGDDPERLADQYIGRVYFDRYLDDDEDQEYIRTGLRAEMRQVAPSEQLKTVKDAVDGLTAKYNTLVPIFTVDSKNLSNEEIERIAGKKLTVEELEDGREGLRDYKKPAFYNPETEEIVIFADKIDLSRIEECFFHENIHRGLEQYLGENVNAITEEFWNSSTSEASEANKDKIAEMYKDEPEKVKEEYLVSVFGVSLTKGTADKLFARLADEHKIVIDRILTDIGYDRAKETAERTQSEETNVLEQSDKEGVSVPDNRSTGRIISPTSTSEEIKTEESKVDTNPSEAQKEAGNYQKGHIKVDGFDVTIENPKGSIRRGTDADGKQWEQEMHNTYGYIKGTEGVDGDHIDVFLSDNPASGKVWVIDQVNPKTGEFDEHKVMYGFPDAMQATQAYLSNYEEGWQGLGAITGISRDEFKKWVKSSHRKTKPFAEYKSVKPLGGQNVSHIEQGNERKSAIEPEFEAKYQISPKPYTTKKGKVLDLQLVKFADELKDKVIWTNARQLAKDLKGWWSREDGGFLMRDAETAQQLADTVLSQIGDNEAMEQQLRDERLSLSDMALATDEAQNVEAVDAQQEAEALTQQPPQEAQGSMADNEYGANNTLVSRDRYEELKERMRKKMLGQLNMGIDPEILAIGTEMAAFHIEAGARKFADFAKKMIEDLGDAIRPYLKSFYNGARDLPEVEKAGYTEEMSPYDEVKKFDVANFDKASTDSMAAAEQVMAEQEAARQAEEATQIIREIAGKGSKSEQKRGKATPSKKKRVSLQQEPDLFGNSFGEESTSVESQNKRNNGHERIDAVRPERLSADDNQQGEHTERRSQASGQEDKRADRGREVRGNGSLQQGLHDGLRPSEQLASTPSAKPQGARQPLERPNNPKNTHNNHAERGKDYAPRGVDARIDANIKAIELMKQLMDSGEQATPEQMAVLRQFSGWGGLGKAFSTTPQSGATQNTSMRLRELLGEEAYQQANMSRNSAYYTPANVIDALWDVARAMGFKGGRVLEGSAGIGNILGLMPTDMSERSDIHAVEIDQTTGNILSLLYPDAKVDVQGFEATQVENGSVDLAITNVPFVPGMLVPKDTSGDSDLSRKFRNSIQDFCIAKNVRKLREGGIGIFITSRSTLDDSARLREWVIQEGGADVVGAFRLNNETFGGTGATSDIIVIRKRVNGKKSPHSIDVLSTTGERTAEYDTGETKKVKGKEIPIIKQLSMDYNSYFVEHPEMMGGEMHFNFEMGETRYPTSRSLFPVKGKNQADMLKSWSQSFDGKDWGEVATVSQLTEQAIYEELGEGVKEGSMVVSNGQLCIAQRGKAVPLAVNANKVKGHSKVECFEAYLGIKKALSDLLQYQTDVEDDSGLQPLLKALNKAYDDFVKTYGHLHKNTSISFLKSDVDFANILALEKFSERGDVKTGKRIQEFGKTDIFSQRVVEKEKAPEPTNVQDGIIASIYVHGRVDVPWIVEQLNRHGGETAMHTEEEVKAEIVRSGLGFENPVTRQMEVSYEYLSGNVREKLAQAQANNADGQYDANIKALEAVVPMDIPAHLIDFSIGSSWIDPKLYEEYVKEKTDIDVTFTSAGGTWFMRTPYSVSEQKNRAMGVVSELLHKTIMGTQLIEAAMQNKTITVSETHKKWDGSIETITDKEATQACSNKIDEIRQDFKEWARAKMQSDPAMSERIERIYNDMFNNYVPRAIPDEFVPSHFGGAATTVDGKPFSLRPHQGKAVIRGTMQPLLLAHEVGSGKTYTLISTAMEMRRLGTARKPMIVVQNATVGQFVESAKKLYPNAKVLTLEDKDHTGEGRKNFYAKIKYNDWDMIVVPQSVFERIPDSEERQMKFVQDKIEEKMLVLEQMRDADPDSNSWIVKQAEKEIDKLEDELAGLTDSISSKRKERDEKKEAVTRQNAEVKALEMLDRQTDDVENFDDMGIDAILVDEAHEYKHLGFATAMQRGVKGVDPSYSKKAQGVYLKTQAVLEKNNGRNVVFATGTPISNTAAEIWTFMRYLMPADTMKEYGIYYFDDFVRNFGNLQQMLEFTTSGKFKEVNRFAGYVNLPELVRIWAGVADTVLNEDVEKQRIAEGGESKIPEMEGGKATDIYLPQTRALRSVMKYVKKQLDDFDKMSGKDKKANSHIPLTMYGIAKAAAVDARLVVSDAADEPQSKTNEAVRQTLRSLRETESYSGTVALFADNYQNKRSGFNLYEDIREKLIAQGVPAEQIVVMKSGMSVKKKLEIFDKVNRGEIRVIMGSTFTLGTGVNIQERLHTLIHLDAPNRPMDYTQRNGRILRQGNLHKQMGKPVRVLRFGVEDSLDVTAYQRLKTKGAIADSIMNGKQMMSNSMENRALEEEEDVFGDTVAQLSGSEYAMLKNQAEKDVRKYEAKKKQYQADQTYCHNEIPRLEGEIKTWKSSLEKYRKNLEMVEALPQHAEPSITVGKQKFPSVEAMADFIKEYNKSIKEAENDLRDNPSLHSQTRRLTVNVGGIDFEFTTEQNVETKEDQGTLFSAVRRKMTYSCEALGLTDVPVHQSLLREGLEDIVKNVISGHDFREGIERSERIIDKNEKSLAQVRERHGKPFEFEKELEQAHERFNEYSELMKKELEEKEKKYAEMDADIEEASDISEAEEADDETEDEDSDVHFRDGEDDVESINEQFNKELQMQIDGTLPQGHIYDMGMPSDILLSTGIANVPIQLNSTRLESKSSQFGHDFALSEIKDLVKAINDPVAIFAYGDKEKAQNIIVEIQKEGNNFVVGLSIRPSVNGRVLEVNSIRNVFPKKNAEWLNWINKGKLLYVDKEKIQNLINQQRTILADVEYLDLDSAAKVVQNFENPNLSEENLRFRIREDVPPRKTGIGYKVFVLKDGQLYPPMVANPDGAATPTGVWLDADAAPVAGMSKTGRAQVKAGGKGTQGGSGTLAYRPGWHLGTIPYALQFNRKNPETGERDLFPANFVWAEVEYANDVDYQQEAHDAGVNANGKYQHSLAGLKRVPVNGSYMYRTNPNPETDPWIITGAMKVKRILKPSEVDAMVKAAGREPQQRQDGYITDAEIEALNKEIDTHEREGEATKRLTYEESLAMSRRAGYTKKQHDARQERAWRHMHEAAESTVERLGLGGRVTIMETPDGLKGRKAKAKGWFDAKTGKIVVVLGNHRSVSDVVKTILHEGVAHYGLRKLFGQHFDQFLDNVYQYGDESVRREIVELAKKHGWDFRVATEEYLARLAEDTDFERATNQGWWSKIKSLFLDMLHHIGLGDYGGAILTNNELRYILWRSYENLAEPGRYRNPFDVAENVAMEVKLGLVATQPQHTGLVEEEIPLQVMNRKDEEKIRQRVAHMTAAEALEAYQRINDNMRDENGLDLDEHFEKTKRDWIAEHGIKGVGKQQADELQKAMDKYGSGMVELRWELKDRLDELGVDMEENSDEGVADGSGKIHYRDGESDGTREAYDKAVNTGRKKTLRMTAYNFREAFQDALLSVRKLQEVVEKKYGVKLSSHEDAWKFENALSSINMQQTKKFVEKLYEPMMKIADKLLEAGATVQELNEYLICKHGLERNMVFAQRDFEKYQQEHPYGEKTFEDFRRDYSGLTAITGKEDLADIEAEALKRVQAFEKKHGQLCSELWDAVNKATKWTLEKSYQSGMMSKDTYEKVRDMFTYYIPLRGWDADTAEDVYDYMMSERGAFNGTLKKAEGRTSLADDPLATIGNMGESAILQGNRNLLKRKLLNMAMNYPTDVCSVRDMWIVENAQGEWEANFPRIPDDATADEVAQLLEQHEADMEALAQNGKAKRVRNSLDIDFRIDRHSVPEHAVVAYMNGRQFVVYINGNPRAAQAINGRTGESRGNSEDKWRKLVDFVTKDTKRYYSSAITQYSPNFAVANIVRDLGHSIAMTYVNKGVFEMAKFVARLPQSIAFVLKNQAGVGGNTKTDKYFKEFVENGGITGYAHLNDVDRWKADNAKRWARLSALQKVRVSPVRGVKAILDVLGWLSETLELTTRFNTYQAERRDGKDVGTSIKAAKDITVNFNKKGSEVTPGIWGAVANTLRFEKMFFNPIVQGLNQFFEAGKAHPVRFAVATLHLPVLGAVMPYANMLLVEALAGGDGDDDKDKYDYWLQNEYTRRNNVLIFTGKGYIKIPIAPGFRELYGMGEAIATRHFGKADDMETAKALADQLRTVFSVEGQAGYNEWSLSRFLLPEHMGTVVDVMNNENFTGGTLYNENIYREHEPEYQKAKQSTWSPFVSASKQLNEWAGGDEDVASPISGKWMNPAVWQHIVSSYGGGFAQLVGDVTSTASNVIEGKEQDSSQWPMLKRFYTKPTDERANWARYGKYKKYKEEYDYAKEKYSAIGKKDLDPTEEAEEISRFVNRHPKAAAIYDLWEYEGYVKELKELRQDGEEEEYWQKLQETVETTEDALRQPTE